MPSCIRSTLAITMTGNVLWITAPLQLINKTPCTLTVGQHGLHTIVTPASRPSDSLLATTPLVHIETPSEKLRNTFYPLLLYPGRRHLPFDHLLDTLEAQFKSRSFVSKDNDDETLFSCLVALPTNQKEVVALPVHNNTTFEDLLVACWKNTYPLDPSPSPSDFYFLHLQPQHIVRVEMGECVSNFRESPRFLLRSVHHGIEGSVVQFTANAAGLEHIFAIEKDVPQECEGYAILAEASARELRLSVADEGVSLGELLTSELRHRDFTVPSSCWN